MRSSRRARPSAGTRFDQAKNIITFSTVSSSYPNRDGATSVDPFTLQKRHAAVASPGSAGWVGADLEFVRVR